MRKLLELKDGQVISSGAYKSLARGQDALWRDSKNFLFFEQAAEKMPGWVQYKAKTSPIYGLEQAYVDGEQRTYYATTDTIYKDLLGTETIIGSGFGGFGYWSMVPWGNWLIATNDAQVPQIWKNTGTMMALANYPAARARLLKKWKNHLLAYTNQTVYWSSDSAPEVWAASSQNSAGSIYIRDLDGDITAAQPLGGAMAVYSNDTMMIQQYLGQPFYFGFPSTPINGIGAVSDSAIIPVASKNYGLSRKGFFVTDGVGFDPIGSPAINKWFQANMDWTNARRTVGLHWEKLGMVCWWFPCKDGVVRGLAYRYGDPAWAPLEMDVKAAAEQQVFDYPLLSIGNAFGFLGQGSNLSSNPMPAFLQTFPAHCGEEERFKVWDMLRVGKESVGTAEFRLGFSDDIEAEPDWTSWMPLLEENWINGRSSIYITVAFQANTLGANLRLGSMSLHGEMGAYR